MDPLLDCPTTQPPDAAEAGPPIRTLALRFHGTGAAWCRRWLIDLALTVATLSLYAPVARARRIAWFRRHASVGRDALVFHADPWPLLGWHGLISGLLLLSIGLAWRGSPLAAVPLAAVVLVGPAFWRAARRWRLRHTVWRGVRLDHVSDRRRAYTVAWPALAWALAGLVGATLAAWPVTRALAGPWLVPVGMAWLGVAVAGGPWWVARWLRHGQGALAWGPDRARLLVDLRRVRALVWRAQGLAVLAALVAAGPALAALRAWPAALAWPLAGVWAAGVSVLWWAWVVARFQNLIWGHTWMPRARGRSDLRWRTLAPLALRCFALSVLTLGLYWPFARVRIARCRLEAVCIDLEGDLPAWGAHAPSARRAVVQSTSRRA